MANSYAKILIHYTFSTKNRQKIIPIQYENRIWQYMGGIARKHNMVLLAAGGVEDHVHLLLSLPRTLSIAAAIKLIKGGSSTWMHSTFPELEQFAWQEGYGAFSISHSHLERVKRYILNQKKHHRKKTFEEEFINLLKKYDVPYDERYIWD